MHFYKNGIIKRTNLSEFKNIRSVGVRAINLDENDALVTAKIISSDIKEILVVTYEGMCVRFGVDNVREIDA